MIVTFRALREVATCITRCTSDIRKETLLTKAKIAMCGFLTPFSEIEKQMQSKAAAYRQLKKHIVDT